MKDDKAKREWVFERANAIALWEGLDAALIGIVTRCGQDEPVAVYEKNAVIRILAEGMTFDDAVEWIDHNINGSWIGESTPFMLELCPRRRRAVQISASGLEEISRLRDALSQIAANNDEPYARDFARDILARREVK